MGKLDSFINAKFSITTKIIRHTKKYEIMAYQRNEINGKKHPGETYTLDVLGKDFKIIF